MLTPNARRILPALLLIAACAPPQEQPPADTAAPAMPPAPSTTASTPTEEADTWMAAAARDEMDDSPRFSMMTDATEKTGQYNPYQTPHLVVRCWKNETALYVSEMTPAKTSYDDDNVHVRLRFDDAPPVSQAWNEGSDNNVFFTTNPVGLAKRLTKVHTLRLSYNTLMGDVSVVTFDLSGMQKHLPQLAKTCGWSI